MAIIPPPLLYLRQIAMKATPKSALGSLVRGLSWVFFGSGALSFFWGGRFISEFGRTDRVLAEVEGIGLALVCGGLGFVAKTAGEHLAECDEEADLRSEPSSGE